MNYIIRKRKKEDCFSIAHVVTVAWNETYPGIVPEWFLEHLKTNEKERAEKSLNDFDENNNHQLVLEINKEIVGFANLGKSDDEEYQCGEIFALYILKKYHGKGLGKKMIEAAKEELKQMGFNSMIIACLKGNPTNSFYKHIGGVYVKDGIFKRLDLPENIYYFDNL